MNKMTSFLRSPIFSIATIMSNVLILLVFDFEIIHSAPFQNYLTPIASQETFSGIELVDAVYLINLDRRPDRLDFMNNIFNKHEIQAIRVSACDGKLLPEDVFQELTGVYYKTNFLIKNKQRSHLAAIGCLLSHLSVLHDAYIKGFEIIWVLEDDIKVVGDISLVPDLLAKLLEFDPDWDIFYTDVPKQAVLFCPPGLCTRKRKEKQIETQGDLFNLIRWRYGTYSMLISRNGIMKILNYFQSADIYGPIDNDIHCIPGIREYSVQANIVTHAGIFQSDIECAKE